MTRGDRFMLWIDEVGGYLVCTSDEVVIGQPLTLRDAQIISIGEGVELRFRVPHPLSATARLEFVSRHRTQPAADAVLLAAETCVLGPRSTSHVVCRDWPHEVVLHRVRSMLHCWAHGKFRVNQTNYHQQAPLSLPAQIVGEGFSLSLEGV
jgi:hypothetical protein